MQLSIHQDLQHLSAEYWCIYQCLGLLLPRCTSSLRPVSSFTVNHNSNRRVVGRPTLDQKHLNPNFILYWRHAMLYLDVSHCGIILMNFKSKERKCFQKCSWNLLPNELVLSFVEKSAFLFFFKLFATTLKEKKTTKAVVVPCFMILFHFT